MLHRTKRFPPKSAAGSQDGGNATMHTGTFTPISAYAKMDIEHGLGAAPDIWFCYAPDSATSQTSAQMISKWENAPNDANTQLLVRSRSGVKYYSGAEVSADNYKTVADATCIYFGGAGGTPYSWAVDATYTWVAIRYAQSGGE